MAAQQSSNGRTTGTARRNSKRIATLLMAATVAATSSSWWIQPAQASSKPLAPHKRAHIPTNLSYTLIRRGSPEDAVRHAVAAKRSPGELLGGSFKHAKAKKRSSPPAPFQLLDGNVHQPEHSDTILVQFDVPNPHDDSNSHESDGSSSGEVPTMERISMLLRPTQDLIHPDAKFVYTTTDPLTGESTEHSEPLHRESVLAYSGYVLHEDQVQARLQAARIGLYLPEETQRGWARLTLNSPLTGGGENRKMLAEGAFELDGEMHHVKSLDSWRRSKRQPQGYESHIHPRHLEQNEGLVLLRDRDLDFGSHDLPWSVKRELAAQGLPSEPASSCSHDSLEFNTDQQHPIYQNARQMSFEATHGRKEGWLDSLLGMSPASGHVHGLTRRQNGGDLAGGGNLTSNYINSIGSTTGCPKSPQVLYMGLAADCTYTATYGDANATRTQLLSNINTVSALYQRTFNVSLGVVELNVQEPNCPSTTNSSVPWNVGCGSGGSGLDLNGRLSAFSQWRGRKGGADGAGLWHLFSDCSSGSEVGVAWLGTLCRVGSSTSSRGETTSGTGVTTITDREWQVFAHEVGHNFGAIHDCRSGCSLSQQCCPLSTQTCNSNGAFIMSPVSQSNTNGTFSPCSVGNICSGLGTTLNTTCLYTPGNREVISLNQCGNGILEPGEECDPGQSDSNCCDRSTCQLRSGALCDPATSSCCTDSCQYAPSSRVCRPAVNEQCDIAESCTGSSGDCPEDQHQSDGTSCGDNGLQCANGYCTSKDEQCRTLGAANGITQACSSFGGNTCQVTCQSPSSSLSCVILEGQNFVQGTSCGYGGRCDATGNCVQGNWQDTVSSWYRDNLRISIPVTVVGGIIVLLILFGIIRCCTRRCRGGSGRKANSSKYYRGAPPMPPPQMQQPHYGQGNYPMPQQPYPTYGNGGYPQTGYR